LSNKFKNKKENYTAKKQLLISYFSGLSASLLTMPIWTLRTRISLITLNKEESSSFRNRFNVVLLVIKESIEKEGFLKLYKGALSSVILSFHGGIQMTIYETLKNYLRNKETYKISNIQGSFLGVTSKVIASSILYPFNVIRARQQQFDKKSPNLDKNLLKNMLVSSNEYGMFINTARIVYNMSGPKGFYKGLSATILRQLPGSSLFFYTYEYTLNLFKVS
jgi:solute carrier family 25 folate transporter 32